MFAKIRQTRSSVCGDKAGKEEFGVREDKTKLGRVVWFIGEDETQIQLSAKMIVSHK